MKNNLLARKTETARNILLKMVKQVQEKIKVLMFKYIEKGVGERGVSLVATRNIIDTFKVGKSLNITIIITFHILYDLYLYL